MTNNLWIVLQEGGSSMERYVTAHPTKAAAQAFRIECAAAAYLTSPPFQIPDEVFASDALFDLLDLVVEATLNFGYPGEE